MTCDISCANVRTPSYFAPCVLKVVAAGAKPYFSAGIACATPINSCSKRFSNSSCACTGDIWVPTATFTPIEPVCADPPSVQQPRTKAVQTYRRRIDHLIFNFTMLNSLITPLELTMLVAQETCVNFRMKGRNAMRTALLFALHPGAHQHRADAGSDGFRITVTNP